MNNRLQVDNKQCDTQKSAKYYGKRITVTNGKRREHKCIFLPKRNVVRKTSDQGLGNIWKCYKKIVKGGKFF